MENNYSYLRLSVTDQCQFNCFYCQPRLRANTLPESEKLGNREILFLAKNLVERGVKHIRLTGGEPLLRADLFELISDLSDLDGIECLSMTTNGYNLAHLASRLKESGLSSINVSLDTLREERFKKLAGVDGLLKVLEGIREAKRVGFEQIRLNIVLMRGFNDDEILDFVDFGVKNDLDVRFIEYFTSGSRCELSSQSFVSSSAARKVIEDVYGALEYLGSDVLRGPAVYYRPKGVISRVGFISSVTGDFCSDCNRIRLSCDGKLYLCLHSDFSINLNESLRSLDAASLDNLIENCFSKKKLYNKHLCHRQFEMSSIGG